MFKVVHEFSYLLEVNLTMQLLWNRIPILCISNHIIRIHQSKSIKIAN